MPTNDFRLVSYSARASAAAAAAAPTAAATAGGPPRAGLLVGDRVVDAGLALDGTPGSLTTLQLLADWPSALARIAAFLASASVRDLASEALDAVTLHAPVLYPGTVYCAGANYRDHIIEMSKANGQAVEADPRQQGIPPWHFVKPARSCVVGPDAAVERPEDSRKLDWEAELAVVIGRMARHVSVHEALDHVAGYAIANDLSARDLSRRPQVEKGSPFYYDWLAHKSFEGSCPLGPWMTPRSLIDDPQDLAMQLWVNDVLKQDSSTAEMIYTVAEQIAHISRTVTLHPGDVLLTGTPAGVGAARGEFLQPGDRVRISIERLGTLETNIR